MKTIDYEVKNDEFIIHNYNNKKPFASFLPAIAGEFGAPLWVFYVNRAQAISCFGSKDKNGAILEFVAANKAYRLTPLQGFRTFIKINNKFYEPFQNSINSDYEKIQQDMYIKSDSIKIVELNKGLELLFETEYFILPMENIPALIRILSIKNLSNRKKSLECIDGLPLINPYGTTDFLLKNMSRLAEGWFSGVTFIGKNKIPIYKLQVEPEDRPEVIPIEKANFYFGFYFINKKIKKPDFIVESEIIFGEKNDFILPLKFIDKKFKIPKDLKNAANRTPSGFGYFKITLPPNEVIKYISIVGNTPYINELDKFINKFMNIDYIYDKKRESEKIHNEIKEKALTISNIPEFDNYCQQTFLDNILRGGYPVELGKNQHKKIYYLYSRIHGDMEREYNNFVILPEFFSQGNGSYRDVNQNRRNDVFFAPFIEDEEIIYFLNLIQLDGFNPLGIIGFKFEVTDKTRFVNLFKTDKREIILKFIEKPFTLGEFFIFLNKEKIELPTDKENFINILMEYTRKIEEALPGTGYWSDHWHYNIDLLETFLSIYPEKLEEILFKKKVFKYYDNPLVVQPRKEKYVLFNGEPYQLKAVIKHDEKENLIKSRLSEPYWVRTSYGRGEIYYTILIEKLLCLVCNKFASFDPAIIGIEMESDKPNWCDALNGLPGLFGSSSCETIELKRLISFILNSLSKLQLDDNLKFELAEEIIDYLSSLKETTLNYLKEKDKFKFWDETHSIKERYREITLFGISGNLKTISISEIKDALNLFLKIVNEAIDKAFDKKGKKIFSYFKNEVIEYEKLENNKIKPLKFKSTPLPLFLEGPVHYLRILKNYNKAKEFHKAIVKSKLYDRKLKMFKLNESLKNETNRIGRIKVFPPGWLENESIWLHMEYKYFLELLRNELIDEFYNISKNALVPFLNPEIYGRSIFENVSFICSSAHPDKTLWGQGFVSRLSGSTAEFLSIWIAITSGLTPFFIKDDKKLYLKFEPKLHSFLFTEKEKTIKLSDGSILTIPQNSFAFNFLGKILVIYHNPKRKNTYGKNSAKIYKFKLYYENKIEEIESEILTPPYSYDVRNLLVKKIEVWLK